MRNVLVTGASGFIGRHLVEALLTRGYSVRALVRDPSTAAFDPRVEVRRGDVREGGVSLRDAFAGCDTVVHLAARVHALSSSLADDPEQDAVTREGTRNVADACASAGVQRLVFLSTLAVYQPSDQPLNEDSPVAPQTSYGKAKLAAEELVFTGAKANGFDAVVLRPAMVYGPGCKGNLPRLVRAVARPVFAVPGGPDNRRGLLHVENLVQAIVLAATRQEARGRVYIVTDARDYSTREMVDAIARAIPRRLPVLTIPRAALVLAARAGDLGGRMLGRRLPFDTGALQKLTESQYFSSARIERELGYRPQRDFPEAAGEVVRAVLSR